MLPNAVCCTKLHFVDNTHILNSVYWRIIRVLKIGRPQARKVRDLPIHCRSMSPMQNFNEIWGISKKPRFSNYTTIKLAAIYCRKCLMSSKLYAISTEMNQSNKQSVIMAFMPV